MKTFWMIASPVLNIVLFAVFQIIGVFVHFEIYGSGASADKNTWMVSLVFALMQMLVNGWLYYKKRLITNGYVFLICILIIVLLYVKFTLIPTLTDP